MSRFTLRMSVAAMALAIGFGPAWAEEAKKPEDKGQGVENLFKKKDANGDGKLSPEEFKKDLPEAAQARADARFKKLDTNNDGSLSLDEFKAGMSKAAEGKAKKKEEKK